MDVPVPSARERLGRSLASKVRLESILGSGGTAVVYRATTPEGEPVAVKVLHEYLTSSPEVCARFLREIYVANLLEHPGTVRVLDDGITDDGTLFFVLELLEGETLEERRMRAGGTLPMDDVLDLADRILAVLELAHSKGVVHRDVKPSNVFMCRDGVLKVLDFGIARLVGEASSATVTKTGQTMGTPAFMPPEQALSRPREIDVTSDLWAVAATMFTLLSGEHVHAAESASEHLVKAATAEARSIAAVIRGVPGNLEEFLAKALSFAKSERFADATTMRAALAAVRREPGKLVGTPTTPPPSRRRTSSNAPTVVTRASEAPSSSPMTVSAVERGGAPRVARGWWPALAVAAALVVGLAGRAARVATPASASAAPPPAATTMAAVPTGATLVPSATASASVTAAASAAAFVPPKVSVPARLGPRSAPKGGSRPGGSNADLYRPF
jgi:serine/threonine-protein kinase